MNLGNGYICIEEILAKGLNGKGILFGDDDFSESSDFLSEKFTFNHYHLYGKISSCEAINNKLVVILEWAEILYNSAHSSDDWLPYGENFCIDFILVPAAKYRDSGDRIHLHEKNIEDEVRTFIYVDMVNSPAKRTKYRT